jgi:spermidine synthase
VVVFLSGFGVLALEILASRYLTPAFGTSLFVWSAVLSITLLALAAGYRWGGRLAEELAVPTERRDLFLAATGAWTALLPAWGPWAIRGAVAVGPYWGPPLAVTLLFGAPLLLLATAVPLTFGPHGRGARLGDLFAVSTAGSVAGALLTGYVAVPRWGVRRSLLAVALLLLAAAAPGLLRRRRARSLGAGALGFLAGMAAYLWLPGLPLAPGVSFLHRQATRYHQLDVLEDARDGSRVLLLDGAGQNWVEGPDWRRSGFGYIRLIVDYGRRTPRPARHPRALLVGLGAGTLARELAQYGYRVEAVEIDSAVVEVAERFFAFPRDKIPVTIADARPFLENAARRGERYDLIVLDATGGGEHPAHLYNRDVYRLLRGMLTEKGRLVLNLVLLTGPEDDQLARHTVASVAPLFEFVEAVDLFPEAHLEGGASQLLLFASVERPPFPVGQTMPGRLVEPEGGEREITDDWNPAPLWSLRTVATWHRATRAWLGDGILVPG